MAKTPGSLPSISVVVPYFENQEGLNNLLFALDRQSYGGFIECIVADDGSASSPYIPTSVETPVRIVQQENLGFRAAAARNLGAADAQGEILAFIDGDTVPRPEYLAQAITPITENNRAVVVGARLHSDGREPQWLREAWRETDHLRNGDDSCWRFVISAVLTCSRDFFERVGGFDESMVGYGGEDWEFAWRAWNAGADFVHVPEAIADHPEGDWGARQGSQGAAFAQKNVETRALATRITHPLARPTQAIFAHPDTVVLFPDEYSRWSTGVAEAVILGWLAQADTHVVLPSVCKAVEIFAADPRVSVASEEEKKAHTVIESARFHLQLRTPVHPPEDWLSESIVADSEANSQDCTGFAVARDTEGLGGNVLLKDAEGHELAQVRSARYRVLASENGDNLSYFAEVTVQWKGYSAPIRLEGLFAGW